MVGNAPLRIIIGAYALASVSRSNLALAVGRYFFVLLGDLHIVKLGLEHFECLVAILELASLLLTLYHYSRRLVRKSYGRFGLVDVLTARAA